MHMISTVSLLLFIFAVEGSTIVSPLSCHLPFNVPGNQPFTFLQQTDTRDAKDSEGPLPSWAFQSPPAHEETLTCSADHSSCFLHFPRSRSLEPWSQTILVGSHSITVTFGKAVAVAVRTTCSHTMSVEDSCEFVCDVVDQDGRVFTKWSGIPIVIAASDVAIAEVVSASSLRFNRVGNVTASCSVSTLEGVAVRSEAFAIEVVEKVKLGEFVLQVKKPAATAFLSLCENSCQDVSVAVKRSAMNWESLMFDNIFESQTITSRSIANVSVPTLRTSTLRICTNKASNDNVVISLMPYVNAILHIEVVSIVSVVVEVDNGRRVVVTPSSPQATTIHNHMDRNSLRPSVFRVTPKAHLTSTSETVLVCKPLVVSSPGDRVTVLSDNELSVSQTTTPSASIHVLAYGTETLFRFQFSPQPSVTLNAPQKPIVLPKYRKTDLRIEIPLRIEGNSEDLSAEHIASSYTANVAVDPSCPLGSIKRSYVDPSLRAVVLEIPFENKKDADDPHQLRSLCVLTLSADSKVIDDIQIEFHESIRLEQSNSLCKEIFSGPACLPSLVLTAQDRRTTRDSVRYVQKNHVDFSVHVVRVDKGKYNDIRITATVNGESLEPYSSFECKNISVNTDGVIRMPVGAFVTLDVSGGPTPCMIADDWIEQQLRASRMQVRNALAEDIDGENFRQVLSEVAMSDFLKLTCRASGHVQVQLYQSLIRKTDSSVVQSFVSPIIDVVCAAPTSMSVVVPSQVVVGQNLTIFPTIHGFLEQNHYELDSLHFSTEAFEVKSQNKDVVVVEKDSMILTAVGAGSSWVTWSLRANPNVNTTRLVVISAPNQNGNMLHGEGQQHSVLMRQVVQHLLPQQFGEPLLLAEATAQKDSSKLQVDSWTFEPSLQNYDVSQHLNITVSENSKLLLRVPHSLQLPLADIVVRISGGAATSTHQLLRFKIRDVVQVVVDCPGRTIEGKCYVSAREVTKLSIRIVLEDNTKLNVTSQRAAGVDCTVFQDTVKLFENNVMQPLVAEGPFSLQCQAINTKGFLIQSTILHGFTYQPSSIEPACMYGIPGSHVNVGIRGGVPGFVHLKVTHVPANSKETVRIVVGKRSSAMVEFLEPISHTQQSQDFFITFAICEFDANHCTEHFVDVHVRSFLDYTLLIPNAQQEVFVSLTNQINVSPFRFAIVGIVSREPGPILLTPHLDSGDKHMFWNGKKLSRFGVIPLRAPYVEGNISAHEQELWGTLTLTPKNDETVILTNHTLHHARFQVPELNDNEKSGLCTTNSAVDGVTGLGSLGSSACFGEYSTKAVYCVKTSIEVVKEGFASNNTNEHHHQIVQSTSWNWVRGFLKIVFIMVVLLCTIRYYFVFARKKELELREAIRRRGNMPHRIDNRGDAVYRSSLTVQPSAFIR